MGFFVTYMWDFTLHLYFNNLFLMCESLLHESFPLNKSHFQSMSIQWWSLEFECGCTNLSSHCCQHALVLCTTVLHRSTVMTHAIWLLCMDSFAEKTFDLRDLHIHGSIVNSILLARADHHFESSALIPIIQFEGINTSENFTNGQEQTTQLNLTLHFNPKSQDSSLWVFFLIIWCSIYLVGESMHGGQVRMRRLSTI